MKKSPGNLSPDSFELPKQFSLCGRNKTLKLSHNSPPLVSGRHSFPQEATHDDQIQVC